MLYFQAKIHHQIIFRYSARKIKESTRRDEVVKHLNNMNDPM